MQDLTSKEKLGALDAQIERQKKRRDRYTAGSPDAKEAESQLGALEDRRRELLKKSVKEGVTEGLKEGLAQKSAFDGGNGGGFGGGSGPLIQNAAFGGWKTDLRGGGNTAPKPIRTPFGQVMPWNGRGVLHGYDENGSPIIRDGGGRQGAQSDNGGPGFRPGPGGMRGGGGIVRGPAADRNPAGLPQAPAGVRGGGSRGAASHGFMMRHAMDQLRREGVPEGNLRAAAAHLVGQAEMESGLDPNKSHDGGTGYGIYGARDPSPGRGRRTNMFGWLKENGYAQNSAEGQMRYMAHEAMRKFPKTRRILMEANPETMGPDSHVITKDFESPRIANDRRAAVARSYRIGPEKVEANAAGPIAEKHVMRDSPLSNQRQADAAGMANTPWPLGWAGRPSRGDDMMGRAFGPRGVGYAPKVEASGQVNIHLSGGLEKLPAKVDNSGLFTELNVNRSGRQMARTDDN